MPARRVAPRPGPGAGRSTDSVAASGGAGPAASAALEASSSRSSSTRSLKARAIRWLAQREHSRVELRRKLLPHAAVELEADPNAVDVLLDGLEASGYLSDDRFVESRVQARSARFGNLRIRRELQEHRLALPAETLVQLQESELARARALHDRRFGAPPADAPERARRARFLSGRGFSFDVVARVLGRGGRHEEPD